MYGNVGETWVQIKKLETDKLVLDEIGTQFQIEEYQIEEYRSFPHSYASISYKGIYLFISDDIFKEHFVKWEVFKRYYQLGDRIMLNANGNLGEYTIENIDGDGCYVALSLKHE